MYLETTIYFERRSRHHGVVSITSVKPFETRFNGKGNQTNTLLFAAYNRIAEIVIEHASKRNDLESIRRREGFEEVAKR